MKHRNDKTDALPDWINETELDSKDDEAMRELGRQIAMDGILREHFAGEAGVSPQTTPRQPAQSRAGWIWGVGALAASVLACLLYTSPSPRD